MLLIGKGFYQVELFGLDLTILTSIGAFIETENKSFIYKSISQVSRWSKLPKGYTVQIQPNNLLSMIPGLPSDYHIEINEIGWIQNTEGI